MFCHAEALTGLVWADITAISGSRISPTNTYRDGMIIGECDRAGVKTVCPTMLQKKTAAISIGNAAVFLIVGC